MSGELPFTGFTVAILGVAVGLSWLVAVAAAIVLLGVFGLRVASRKERRAQP